MLRPPGAGGRRSGRRSSHRCCRASCPCSVYPSSRWVIAHWPKDSWMCVGLCVLARRLLSREKKLNSRLIPDSGWGDVLGCVMGGGWGIRFSSSISSLKATEKSENSVRTGTCQKRTEWFDRVQNFSMGNKVLGKMASGVSVVTLCLGL